MVVTSFAVVSFRSRSDTAGCSAVTFGGAAVIGFASAFLSFSLGSGAPHWAQVFEFEAVAFAESSRPIVSSDGLPTGLAATIDEFDAAFATPLAAEVVLAGRAVFATFAVELADSLAD